jgi:hypothetical protein
MKPTYGPEVASRPVIASTEPSEPAHTSEEPILIRPSGLEVEGGREYSDVCLTNLFASHVDLINVERQLTWQRFNSMLVANTIILALLSRGELLGQVAAILCVTGMILCLALERMTRNGWEQLQMRLSLARRFEWRGYPNPTQICLQSPGSENRARIHEIAVGVVRLIFFLYLLLLVNVPLQVLGGASVWSWMVRTLWSAR